MCTSECGGPHNPKLPNYSLTHSGHAQSFKLNPFVVWDCMMSLSCVWFGGTSFLKSVTKWCSYFLTYNKCIPTPYITLLADKWNSKFEPFPSSPLPSQLHLTPYYSKLLAIFGQQFAYLQSLLNFSMETKDEGEFVLCLETKEHVWGEGEGGEGNACTDLLCGSSRL